MVKPKLKQFVIQKAKRKVLPKYPNLIIKPNILCTKGYFWIDYKRVIRYRDTSYKKIL